VVGVTPRLSFVGVHLFARWLDQQEALELVVIGLKAAISAYQRMHPDDDLALLHHRDITLRHRFAALLLAPLLGIERLSAFDTQEHPMATLIGQSYQATTLSQFLGQLERIEAAPWLMPILLPAPGSQVIYVDGHMMAHWSRKAMHKGKITMRGRIMAGSQAVISHDESGQAVYAAYYPPDLHMLDDGTRLYEGLWKVAREDDRRHFVIVEPQQRKTLVYWGSAKVKAELEAWQWPEVYRARTELQEDAFKRMIDHGALDINVGRKTLLDPDRHQQRAEAKVRDSLEAAKCLVAKRRQSLRPNASKSLSHRLVDMANALSSANLGSPSWKTNCVKPKSMRRTCRSKSIVLKRLKSERIAIFASRLS
jgi:hypothetical protein